MRPLREPHRTLTGHFFRGFFRFTFLDDAGEESVTRSMFALITAIVGVGMLLARLYSRKYVGLSQQATPDRYLLMLPADQMAIIVLTMVIVAFVIAIVSHSIFPDELDFRILMPLPVSRRALFVSKMMALVLFAAIFIIATTVVVGLPFAAVSGGRWAEHALLRRTVVQLGVGLFASGYAVLAVIALQGMVVLLTPKRWLSRVLVATQTLTICTLVLLLPAALRTPRLWTVLDKEPWWLFLVAPGWFLGLERWLLGDPSVYYGRLALTALAASAVAILVVAACYLVLYRRFEWISLSRGSSSPREIDRRNGQEMATQVPTPASSVSSVAQRVRAFRHPAYDAVRCFTSATLGRSGLHQLVACAALAGGLALALNSVMMRLSGKEEWLVRAAVGAPLTAIIVSVLGMRWALLLPANLRAAWIFRMTETDDGRPLQLNAVRHTFWIRGVLLPVALLSSVQLGVLGLARTLACLPVLCALGWIFVDVVTRDWRRIPFTCTILFGKRPAAQTVIILLGTFLVFGVVGTTAAEAALRGPAAWAATMGVVAAIIAFARWQRLQTWGRLPLEFEDYLPDGLDTLRL